MLLLVDWTSCILLHVPNDGSALVVVCSELLTHHLLKKKKKLVWIFHIMTRELLTTCHLLIRVSLVPRRRRPAASTVMVETRLDTSRCVSNWGFAINRQAIVAFHNSRALAL